MVENNNKTAITIKPADIRQIMFTLTGTSPYVQHRFGEKAKREMKGKQLEGKQAQKKRGGKDARDFEKDYEEALYRTDNGRHGIPAVAFRCAMVSACRLCNFTMTTAKISLFVPGNGFDERERTALVLFTKGKPKPFEMMGRIQMTTNITVRPLWEAGWQVELIVEYDADLFRPEDIANLLERAGRQVGIGEGRPDSKKSCGLGWGTFTIAKQKELS